MTQRIVTGVAAGALFLGILWLGGWFYTVLLAAMALIGFGEFARLNGMPNARGDVLCGFAAVLLLTLTRLPESWGLPLPGFEAAAWILLFLLLSAAVFSKNAVNLEHAGLLFIGAVYVGTGFHYMLATRELDHGLFWSALIFACIWASDAGAYFVGKAIGRTKLWPAISPNKTVEGSVGGILLALAAGLIFAWSRPDLLGYAQGAAIGAVAAVAGQLGDLIQSAYKRFRGVKDTGRLLPGHGGILDRTDSWLIVFPLVHLLSLAG